MEVPLYRWMVFVILLKWMRTGGSPIWGNLHILMLEDAKLEIPRVSSILVASGQSLEKKKHQSIVLFCQGRLPQVRQIGEDQSTNTSSWGIAFVPTFQDNTRWWAPRESCWFTTLKILPWRGTSTWNPSCSSPFQNHICETRLKACGCWTLSWNHYSKEMQRF